jgi:hypothetical protein
VAGSGEHCIMRSFLTRTLHRILLEWSSQEGGAGRNMYHVWERWDMLTPVGKRPVQKT